MTPKQNRQRVLDIYPTAVIRYNPHQGRYEVRYEPHGHIIAHAYTRSMCWSKAAERVSSRKITFVFQNADEARITLEALEHHQDIGIWYGPDSKVDEAACTAVISRLEDLVNA